MVYLTKHFLCGRGVRSNISNRKGLQPLKKAMLEEAVKKIVGKSSRSMTAHSARQRTSSRKLQVQDKKKGPIKNVAEFPGTSKKPKVTNVKNPEEQYIASENPVMEYMEYAVAVTSHWDKKFVHKFSTKNYLLETQCQLQDIYCRKKLFASLKRAQPLGMHVETSQVQPDHPLSDEPLSAEQEQIFWSPLLSDSPSVTFSPQIPPPTPVLDPLQYLRNVFPKSEGKTLCLLQNKNNPPEYLPAQYSEVGRQQQMVDNIQEFSHDGNNSTSVEPYSTVPLLPLHTFNADMFDPGAPNKIYRGASLYVPWKFSFSMNTVDVNFKYYPHTF